MKCCLCKKDCGKYGNNPAPVNCNPKARCCDNCNCKIVLPYRIKMTQSQKKEIKKVLNEVLNDKD